MTRACAVLAFCSMGLGCTLDLSEPRDDPSSGGADAGDAAGSDAGSDAQDDAEQEETGGACVPIVASVPIPAGAYAFVSTITPNIGEPTADDLLVELRELESPQAPGTFDLSQGNETNYATCEHCFLLRADRVGFNSEVRTYFPRAGTVTVTAISSPPTPQFAMTLTQLEFEQVEVDPQTRTSTPVAGGACYVLQSANWNTTTSSESDCADAATTCESCCRAYHAKGATTEYVAASGCLCEEAVCEAACLTAYCADPESTEAECAACRASALGPQGACVASVNAACIADPDCLALKACYAQCP